MLLFLGLGRRWTHCVIRVYVWMMGLRKKERTLASFWTSENRELPDNVHTIKLEAFAIGTDKAMLNLGYEFKNSNSCIDWIKSQKDSAL